MSRATTVPRPEVDGDPCVASDVEIGDRVCDPYGEIRTVFSIERFEGWVALHDDEGNWLPVGNNEVLAVIKT